MMGARERLLEVGGAGAALAGWRTEICMVMEGIATHPYNLTTY